MMHVTNSTTGLRTIIMIICGAVMASGQIPMDEVTGLRSELALRPVRGSSYMSNRLAVIGSTGAIEAVAGSLDDCVRVDGTASPCGQEFFVNGETPSGAMDGVNTTYQLSAAPLPRESLQLYRNGLLMRINVDYTLVDRNVTFIPMAVPQSGDIIQAFYRVSPPTAGRGIPSLSKLFDEQLADDIKSAAQVRGSFSMRPHQDRGASEARELIARSTATESTDIGAKSDPERKSPGRMRMDQAVVSLSPTYSLQQLRSDTQMVPSMSKARHQLQPGPVSTLSSPDDDVTYVDNTFVSGMSELSSLEFLKSAVRRLDFRKVFSRERRQLPIQGDSAAYQLSDSLGVRLTEELGELSAVSDRREPASMEHLRRLLLRKNLEIDRSDNAVYDRRRLQ